MVAARKQAPPLNGTKPPIETLEPALEQSEEPALKEIALEDIQASREFQAITDFLGNGGADGRTDDEVWPILAETVSCLLACLGWGLNCVRSILTSLRESGLVIGINTPRKSTKL